ncbi:spermidine sinapoyl-CoA acyltransferase-like [Ipomoea triloba]|uniref:spermidine sinapoyl-CoA acyltransferase-like n=1 Tax=Ipomoea triloba TaxID=35885 RepID=UPI00125E46C3|nr:spermidine sinapoyl-CoA acyltransferase-like [Ipomoea triloba]
MATPFLINRKDVVLVKPAEPTPSEILSFSTIDNDPNIELLCQTLYVYQANPTSNSNGSSHAEVCVTPESADPVLVLKTALSKALVYYYPLAGKLKRNSNGRLEITCNGDGVPFMEATADCALSSLNYFDGTDVKIGQEFVFDWPSHSAAGYHPLVLQVTRFSCGGFTVGMGLSHSVCDGYGAALFFRAMTELATGKEHPSVKPVWEREILVGKAISPAGQDPFDFIRKTSLTQKSITMTESKEDKNSIRNETESKEDKNLVCSETESKENKNSVHNETENKENKNYVHNETENKENKNYVRYLSSSITYETDAILHQCFNVDAESIRWLKKRFTEEAAAHGDGESLTEAFTALEVLAAYIWRSRIRALKMNPDGNTILCLAVGIRKLLTDPPLPAGYYGNAFVSANAVSQCKSLDRGPLYKVAKMIKESKKAVSSNDQIRRSIDTLEAFVQGNRKVDGGGAAFVLTDWRQLRLSEEVEFGWGLSVNMIPLPWEMFGYVDLCIFLPPCRVNTAMEGGVRVLVSLPGAAMATFNEEMDALKKWSSDNGMPRC